MMKLKFATAMVLSTSLFPAMALAQAPIANDNSERDIVVTAQKREQLLSDVPISMTVLGGRDLESRGVNSTLDLANYVPGLTIGQNTGDGDFPFISLRGVSMRDFADTNESPSAVYIDDFYKANLMGLDGQTFDIQRVEVLRGPQGTLYGRNATGGLIKYVLRKPGNTFDGHVNAQYGSFNEAKLELAAGGPVTDGLAARFAVVHHRHDGWFNNIYPGDNDGNALKTTAARGQILFDSGNFSALSLVQYYRNENAAGNLFAHSVVRVNAQGLAEENPNPTATDSFGYREPVRSDPRFTNSDRDAYVNTRQFTATERLEWKSDDVSLVSVTGYERSSKDGISDSDSSPFDIRGTEVHPRGKQFSQEFRASGESGPLNWLAGVYYMDYHVYGYQMRYRGPVIGYRPPVSYDLQTNSYAAFVNADFAIGSAVTATGGLRYTKEKKKYSLINREFGVTFNETTAGALARQNDGNWSFNGRLSYKPMADSLFYAGVARSFKAGTFNVGYTSIAFAAIPVRPERLTSYEAGFKQGLLDNRLTLDASAFYYDYKDSQAFQFDGRLGTATTFNRDAKVYGGELEAHLRPVNGLNLGLLVSYINATLKDVNLPTGGVVRDTRMPLSPKWTITGLASYTANLGAGGKLRIDGDITRKTSQYFDAFNSPYHYEPGYTVANASIAWTAPDNRLELSAFVKNIGDRIYRTYSFDLSVSLLATDVYARPRWFGAGLSYRFN